MPPAFALSQDQTLRFIMFPSRKTTTNRPCSSTVRRLPMQSKRRHRLVNVTVTHFRRYVAATPRETSRPVRTELVAKPPRPPVRMPRSIVRLAADNARAPPTYPFHPDSVVKERNQELTLSSPAPVPNRGVRRGRRLLGRCPECVNAITHTFSDFFSPPGTIDTPHPWLLFTIQ